MKAVPLSEFLEDSRKRVNRALSEALAGNDLATDSLYQAMVYSVLNGGKRVRPALVYAAASATGAITRDIDLIASAVELIHAYSLIHDDLPAMDDDDLRRGKPTCHVVFDEATAILAGDGLQALAFEQLGKLDNTEPRLALRLVAILARAAGPAGMVGGQAIDLAAVARNIDLDALENMHCKKTGALISASITLGAMATAQATRDQLAALAIYGEAIGLAFQVQDDILDVESDTETMGKPRGSDLARNKPTYISLLGLKGARDKLKELHDRSLEALSDFDDRAWQLRAIANFIVQRDH